MTALDDLAFAGRIRGFTLIEAIITVVVIIVIVVVSIPHLRESRLTSQESAAAASLKSGILPAEVQFQAGGYADGDGNRIGCYCVLGASGVDSVSAYATLSGTATIGGTRLNLLAPAFTGASPIIQQQGEDMQALQRFTGTFTCTGTVSDDVFMGKIPYGNAKGDPFPYEYALSLISAGINFHVVGSVARQDEPWSTLVEDGDRWLSSLQHRLGSIAITVDQGRITRLVVDGNDLQLHASSRWRFQGIRYEPPPPR